MRFARAAAWVLWVVAVGAAILGLTYGIAEQATGRSIVAQTIFSYLAAVAVAIVYASVGLSLIVRMPRLVIGWLFLLGAALYAEQREGGRFSVRDACAIVNGRTRVSFSCISRERPLTFL